MKNLRSLALLPLATVTASLFAEGAPDADILGALRIGSLQDLAASAGAFADQIEAGSGANTAQLTAGANAFGLALDQELLALVIDPQKAGQPYALVLPVLDPEQFKANPAFKFAPLANSPERFQITLPNGQPMFATFVGKRLVASPLEAGLDAVLPAIRADLDIRGLRAAGGHLALSLDTGRLYTAYKPMVDLMLMGMRSQFAQATAQNPKAPNPADIVGSLLGSVADIQDYFLRLSIDAAHLDLRSVITARPGTDSAALFSAGRGPAIALPGALDPESAVFGTVSASPSPEFWAAYHRMSTRLLGAFGQADADADATKTFAETVDAFASIWDGTGSFAFFTPTQAMSGSGSAGIKDQEKALSLIRRMPELQKTMAAINAAQGIATELTLGEEETLGDARLIQATQSYRATSPEMEAGLQMLQKAGLDNIQATYAITPSRFLYAMGDDSRAETKRLLEASSASSDIRPSAYGLPAESTAFVALSLPRYLGWMSRVASLPFSYDAASAPKKPGLAFTTDLVDGRADIRVRLETTEIVSLKNTFAKPATAAAPAQTVTE